MGADAIYRVAFDIECYQALDFDGDLEAYESLGDIHFDGSERSDWSNVPLNTDNPRLLVPDIWHVTALMGAFAVEPEVARTLAPQFERGACQLIPNHVEGVGPLYLVNVCRVVDCLDEERSETSLGLLQRYCFDASRLPEGGLLKIPQSPLEVLTAERDGGGGFRAAVQQLGLTGLVFMELWNSTEGPFDQQVLASS